MAQPIQYSDAPAQALLNLSQQRNRQDLLMQKAEMEDRKAAAMIPYDFAKQTKNLDRVVAESLGSQYTSNLASAQLGGAGDANLRRMASEYLTDLNTKSNAIKTFRNQGQEYINKMAPSLGIDKGRASQILSGYIATNFMDPDRLSDPAAILNDAIKREPDLFVDNKLGASRFTELMKNAPRYTMAGDVTMNQTGMEKERVDWRSTQPWFYDFQPETEKTTGLTYEKPKLRTDADGFVSQDVFDYFYNSGQADLDFRMKTWIDAGAKRELLANNRTKQPGENGYVDPNDQVALNTYRRKYLTDQINNMNVGSFKLGVQDIKTKQTGGGRGGGRAKTSKPSAPDYIQQVTSVIETGSADDIRSILMRMQAGSGSVKIDEIRVSPVDKGFTVYYKAKEGGQFVNYRKDFNPSSPNFEAELTGFYQRAAGSDIKAEKRVMTSPAKTTPKTAAKPTKKTYKGIDPATGMPILQ